MKRARENFFTSHFPSLKHVFTQYPFLILLLPLLCYWTFLFFTTSMVIVFDADQYQRNAFMILEKGWADYFKNGPFNEPLYPFLISCSMRAGRMLNVSYQSIQTIMQMLFLTLTLFLTWQLLGKLNIHRKIKYTTILYLGISPAIINSTFSLWSEIIILPFALGIILLLAKAWEILLKDSGNKILTIAVGLGALFGLACYVKAMFEFIFYFFFILFAGLLIRFLFQNQKKFARQYSLFLIFLFLSFQISILPVKLANFINNGQFVIAGRGPYIFYGNAVKRTNNVSQKQVLTALASVPGEGICRQLFSDEQCNYWSYFGQDRFGLGRKAELEKAGLSSLETDKILIKEAKSLILQKPLSYFFFTTMEGFKMLFWESTKIGFVRYPTGLSSLYDSTLFKNGLRLLMFFLTFTSLIFVTIFLFRKRVFIFSAAKTLEAQRSQILFLIVFFIFAYTSMYSLSSIVTRYAFALVAPFLICIAFGAQKILDR